MCSSITIVVKTPSGAESIHFKQGFIQGSLRGGVYATEDKEIQKGIESHPQFRSGFNDQIWTDDKEEEHGQGVQEERSWKMEDLANEAAQELKDAIDKPKRVRTFRSVKS